MIPTQKFILADDARYLWVYYPEMKGLPRRRWKWRAADGSQPSPRVCRLLRDIFIRDRFPKLLEELGPQDKSLLWGIVYTMKKIKYDVYVVDGIAKRLPIKCKGCKRETTDYYPDKLCNDCHEGADRDSRLRNSGLRITNKRR